MENVNFKSPNVIYPAIGGWPTADYHAEKLSLLAAQLELMHSLLDGLSTHIGPRFKSEVQAAIKLHQHLWERLEDSAVPLFVNRWICILNLNLKQDAYMRKSLNEFNLALEKVQKINECLEYTQKELFRSLGVFDRLRYGYTSDSEKVFLRSMGIIIEGSLSDLDKALEIYRPILLEMKAIAEMKFH